MSESIQTILARIQKDTAELKRQVLGVEDVSEFREDEGWPECTECGKEHDPDKSCLEAGVERLNV